MPRPGRPPRVFVLAPTAYEPADRFRRLLAKQLRVRGEAETRILLLRPHDQAGIDRELEHARRQWASQFPERPPGFDDQFLSIDLIQTRNERELATALQGQHSERIAIVVLWRPGLFDRAYHGALDYPVRRFIEAGRDDLLIPILVDGEPPTERSKSIGDRLIAATPLLDWRGGWHSGSFDDLGSHLISALETPLPVDRVVGSPALGTRDLVRVDAYGGGDCYRIAEGLALARTGGRVEVAPGTYLESPEIARTVHLVGVGNRETIRVLGSHIALSTEPQFKERSSWQPKPQRIRAVVENLTLESLAGDSGVGATVWLNGGSITFRDCTISARPGGTAISDLGNAGENELRGGVRFERCIVGCGAKGAEFGSRGPFAFTDCVFMGSGASGQIGLAEFYGPTGRADRCTFVDLDWPIQAQSAGRIEVKNSTIVGGILAISCGCRVEAWLHNVRVVDSQWAIQAADDAAVRMSRCRTSGSREGDLVVKGSARVAGWGNSFRDSGGPAIWVAGNADCLMVNSRVDGARWGAVVQDDGSLELAGGRYTGSEIYAIGARGNGTLVARGTSVSDQNIGFQFTEHSGGELVENEVSDSREYGIGIWSDGTVAAGDNRFGRRVKRDVFVAREATIINLSRTESSDQSVERSTT